VTEKKTDDMLWTPLEVRGVRVANRIVAAPTATGTADEEGRPTEAALTRYGALASGGVGLVVMEHHAIRPDGRVRRTQYMLDRDELAESQRKLTALFSEADVPVLVQLNHSGGLVRDAELLKRPGFVPVGPSAVPHPSDEFGVVPRELSREELSAFVASYAAAALRGLSAGYRGVEIHAAHGYFLGQFLSPLTNRRTDQYGGNVQNRARLLLDVADALRDLIGDEAVLSVRLGMADVLPGTPSGGFDVEEAVWVARELVALGVDILDLSGNLCGYDGPGEAYFAPYAAAVSERKGRALVVCTGGIRRRETAERLLRDGVCDLVGLGRPLFADPHFLRTWKE
jgi:2,4-dienoyl-CoA reductase-like NADH-dependent reductase (Old Yellow Enzyme family)